MPDWLDSPGDWSAGAIVVGAVLSGFMWLIRAQIQRTSDQLDVITAQQERVLADVEYLRGRLDQHVDHHNRGGAHA